MAFEPMNDADLIAQLQEKRPWVLLVDDDFHITVGLKDILEDSGYQVKIAHMGEEAMSALHNQAFSVMVVDYSLPDTNGIELTRRVRNEFPHLQVVLMTGHDRFEMQAADMAALFCAFLRKPVEIHAVTDAIGQAVQRQCERLKINVFKNLPTEVLPMVQHIPEAPSIQAPAPAAVPRMPMPVLPPMRMTRSYPVGISIMVFALGLGAGWLARNFYPAIAHGSLQTIVAEALVSTAAAVMVATPTVPGNNNAVVPPVVPIPLPPQPPPSPVPIPKPKRTRLAEPLRRRSRMSIRTPEEQATAEAESKLSVHDFATRLAAAKTLLKLSPDHPRAIRALLAMVQEPQATHRLASIEVLSSAHCATAEVARVIATRLVDDDVQIAYAAASALGHMGSFAVPEIPELAQLLIYKGANTQSVAHAAEDALVQIGKQAVPSLLQQLDNANLRIPVIRVLGRLGPEATEAVSALAALAKDPEAGPEAQEALERIQPKAKPTPLEKPAVDTGTHSAP